MYKFLSKFVDIFMYKGAKLEMPTTQAWLFGVNYFPYSNCDWGYYSAIDLDIL